MDDRSENHRSGVALIIVLGCIVVLSTLAASTARSVATASIAATQHAESLAMSQTLDAARSACTQWLIRHATTAMLDADNPHLGIAVLDEQITCGRVPLHIRIHAFDQSTLIPLDRIPELTEQLGEWSTLSELLQASASPLNRIRSLEEAALENEQTRLIPIPNAPTDHHNQPIPLLSVAQSPSLSVLPTERRRSHPSLSINPRTVPDPVLQVLYPAEAEDVSRILREWRSRAKSRARGKAAVPSLESFKSPLGPVRLIDDSDRWAFLVTSESRTTLRSHWICFERRPGLGWVETLSHIIEEPMR
ncbi:MAG: hypothetical protein ACNA8P_04870 [Phycisphaerales bacterium]